MNTDGKVHTVMIWVALAHRVLILALSATALYLSSKVVEAIGNVGLKRLIDLVWMGPH